MTWKAPFDDPIGLANGKILRTLRDAADHIVSLPRRETSNSNGKPPSLVCYRPLKSVGR
jgi:hypothetical protein